MAYIISNSHTVLFLASKGLHFFFISIPEARFEHIVQIDKHIAEAQIEKKIENCYFF